MEEIGKYFCCQNIFVNDAISIMFGYENEKFAKMSFLHSKKYSVNFSDVSAASKV